MGLKRTVSLAALAALLCACGQPAAPVNPQQAAVDMAEKMAAAQGANVNLDMTAPAVGAHPLTEAEYAQVQPGMSVQQFLAIVGEGCSQTMSVESEGISMQSYTCVNMNGTSANFTFQAGALLQKAKSGNLG